MAAGLTAVGGMVLMGGGLLPSTAAQGLAATAVLAVSAAFFSASCLYVWQAESDLLAAALSMQEKLVCVAKQRSADVFAYPHIESWWCCHRARSTSVAASPSLSACSVGPHPCAFGLDARLHLTPSPCVGTENQCDDTEQTLFTFVRPFPLKCRILNKRQ